MSGITMDGRHRGELSTDQYAYNIDASIILATREQMEKQQ